MSIIRKKYDEGGTDLNKLKFEPNMGSGNPGRPPLITKRIPNEVISTPQVTNELTRRIDDVSRIAQLFTRKEGLGLLANNTALNLAVDNSYRVKSRANREKEYILEKKANVGKSLLETAQTLATTLAQVAVSGTGTHFVKGQLFNTTPLYANTIKKPTLDIGQPGKVVVKYDRDKYHEVLGTVGTDRINDLSPYVSDNPREATDYIKFYFEVLRPGEQQSIFLHFRALLDSFDDNYTGNWDSFNYVGRGEQFHTYRGFNRNINVSFKSGVATKQELAPMYQKLTYLASTTAPTYGQKKQGENGATASNPGIMRGTIVRMNIGDYLYDTPGFINNISYNWESRYPFEIRLGAKDEQADPGNNDFSTQELPHILNCNLTFTPIHTFTPQTGLYHYITNPRTGEEYPAFFNAPDQTYQGGTDTIPDNFNRR